MWTENPIFKEDLDSLSEQSYIPWDALTNKTVFVTGATGLIGYTAVCALLRYNQLHENANIRVVALVRDLEKAGIKFKKQLDEKCDLTLIRGNVESFPKIIGKIDYIIHGACPTGSNFFLEHSVETINQIVAGTKNILDFAREKKVLGVVFISSMEVFGMVSEPRKISEKDLGYIDISSPRSSYPEGKRLAENMCCAYYSEYAVPVISVRLAQTFGPGVSGDDKRVFAYMARCAINGEDICLSTDGAKENMYLYTADAVGAILLLMVNGERGTAYNTGNPDTYCSVKEMGEIVAQSIGQGQISVKTNYAMDNEANLKKYPPNGYLMMDISRLQNTGWKPSVVSLAQMFERMIKCFSDDEEYESGLTVRGEVYALTECSYDQIMACLNKLNKNITVTKTALNTHIKNTDKSLKALNVHFVKTDKAIKAVSEKTDKLSVKFKRKFKAIAKRKDFWGKLFSKILGGYRRMKRARFRIKFKKLPIQENKVLAFTYDKRYNCNIKYIVEEILRRGLPLDIVWVIPGNGKIKKTDYPSGVRLVKYDSREMYMEMATSKVWIDNALNCVWTNGMKKKSGQIYINTWHGSLGIKKLSGDKHWLSRAALCNKETDYCISNSGFEEDVYRETFWKDVPYLRFGHARNDILFSENSELRMRICKRYKITSDKMILLYAPTFRDDGSLDWCDLDFEKLTTLFVERFGGEWVIFIRRHFKNRAKTVGDIIWNNSIIDVTDYIDMMELMAIADAGITDYSSWAFDYVLTKRPMFLYAADIDKYDHSRGFYYPLTETPFPIAQTQKELENNILTFDQNDYSDKVDEFLRKKECVDDGHACERIVDFIQKAMEFEEITQ